MPDPVPDKLTGRRLADNEWLIRAADGKLEPGEYGRCWTGDQWDWFVCCPDGSTTRLWVNEDDKNGNRHVLTEHDDGTITVGGSVLGGEVISPIPVIAPRPDRGLHSRLADYWHGYLRQGKWEPA